MINGVHARHDRKQHLGGAHVAGRLVAPDVLLPSLQRHAERRATIPILGHADDAARQGALVRILGGKECSMGTTVAHGNAKTLAVAHRDVGAPLAWRSEERQAEKARRRRYQSPCRVRLLRQPAEIADLAIGCWVLDQNSDNAALELELR